MPVVVLSSMRSAFEPPWTGSVTIELLVRDAVLNSRQCTGQPSVSSSNPGFGSSEAAWATGAAAIQLDAPIAAASPAAPPRNVRRLILVGVMIDPLDSEGREKPFSEVDH